MSFGFIGASKMSTSHQSKNIETYRKYAKRIVRDILSLKSGENITIEAWEHELEFANEVKYEARKVGANAILITENEPNYWRLFEEGAEASIGNVGKHEWALVENSDAYVFFPGPADLRRYLDYDSKRRASSSSYNLDWYKRGNKAGLRGIRLRTAYATPERARVYGFDFGKWRQNALEGISVDYEKIERHGRKLALFLGRAKKLRIKSANGTDLRMKLLEKPAHIYSGLMKKPPRYHEFSFIVYIPGGTIHVVPDPKSASGTVKFNCPVLQMGKKIEGLEWFFKEGKLAKYSAKKNAGLFATSYEGEKGDKDRLGTIAIGLNPKLCFGFNYDSNVEGAVSLGLGSIGEGDKNKTDFEFLATLTGANAEADGKTFIRNGKLLI